MPTADDEAGYRWRPVRSLAEGDHLHLDGLVDVVPEPGSPGWLPVLDELGRYLVGAGGRWLISLRLGECEQVPTGLVDRERAFRIADAESLAEPPALYRLYLSNAPNRWTGEKHCWISSDGSGVTEVITVSRSDSAAEAHERFSVQLAYEI